MKKHAVYLISLYQKIVSPLLHQALGVGNGCRYSPTCSEYARIHIASDGIILGITKSFIRLLYCQPFAKKLPLALQK